MSDTATTQKWANVDAGPRQVKDLQKAIGRLDWEGKTFDQLTGVVGGTEHQSTMTSPFSPCRPEVTALDEAIRAKYGHRVTKATVRAIIADYEAALPEARKSRPVEDERRSPEADAELTAAMHEREAGYQAERDAHAAVMAAVMAKAPAGAKALIIAERKSDDSDPMTDYFSNHSTRTVAIGWRFTSREDFRALRAAAGRFPDTAHMASPEALQAWAGENGRPDWQARELEHRDNYSMGAGNYLSDHGWDGSGSGWVVRSAALPCKWVSLTEDAIPAGPETSPGPAGASAGGVTVSPSSIGREGVVEVRFDDKPGPDVIAGLKAHGFRWARGNRCWYGSDTAYADSLVTS